MVKKEGKCLITSYFMLFKEVFVIFLAFSREKQVTKYKKNLAIFWQFGIIDLAISGNLFQQIWQSTCFSIWQRCSKPASAPQSPVGDSFAHKIRARRKRRKKLQRIAKPLANFEHFFFERFILEMFVSKNGPNLILILRSTL